MRDRAATLDLEDADIVGIAVAPIHPGAPARPATPLRTSVPPRAPTGGRMSSPPPAPARTTLPAPSSNVAPFQRVPIPATAKVGTPAHAFAPPRVPTFDAPPFDELPIDEPIDEPSTS